MQISAYNLSLDVKFMTWWWHGKLDHHRICSATFYSSYSKEWRGGEVVIALSQCVTVC